MFIDGEELLSFVVFAKKVIGGVDDPLS